ncbi:MAG: hypothetical protein ACLF0G_03470 [Candidatus Brocadiia bacterium]
MSTTPAPAAEPRTLSPWTTAVIAALGIAALLALLFPHKAFALLGATPQELTQPVTARETLREAYLVIAATVALGAMVFLALFGSQRVLREPSLLLAALLVGLVVHSLSVARTGYVPDQAYVNFVYARNLASGRLAFNPGEAVRGYSSFLQVVLLAPFAWLPTAFSLRVVAQGIALVASVPTVSLVYALGRRLNPGRRATWSLAAPLLLVLSPGYTLASAMGTETQLATFLVMLGAFLYLAAPGRRSGWCWPAAFALAALARREALLLLVATVVFEAASGRTRRGRGRLALRCLPALAILVGYYVASTAYFGHLLSTAFLAEGGTRLSAHRLGRGAYYAGAFLSKVVGVSVFLVPLAMAVRGIERRLAYATVLVGVGLAHACVSGGGALPGYQLLAPVLPLLYFALQESAAALYHDLLPRARGGATALNVVLAFALLFAFPVPYFRREVALLGQIDGLHAADSRSLRHLGFALRREEAGTSVAIRYPGQVKFLSGATVIDLSGGCDRTVARLGEGAAPYVLARRPDYLVLAASFQSETGDEASLLGGLERRLYRSEAFREHYAFDRALTRFEPRDGAPGEYLWVFKRRGKQSPTASAPRPGL